MFIGFSNAQNYGANNIIRQFPLSLQYIFNFINFKYDMQVVPQHFSSAYTDVMESVNLLLVKLLYLILQFYILYFKIATIKSYIPCFNCIRSAQKTMTGYRI